MMDVLFSQVDFLLKLTLVLIMFSVGLSLRLSDFNYVLKNSRLLLIGLFSKIILFPLLGFLILEFTTLEAAYKLGIMILLLCAGGTTSNVITYWFKGTSALTIFLTAIAGFLIVFTLPILVNYSSIYYFGEHNQFKLSILDTTGSIVFLIILPAIIGVVINEVKTDLATKIEQVLKPSSVVLLGFVYLIKFFASSQTGGLSMTQEDILALGPILLIINALSLFVGFFIGRLLKVNNKNSMTIGIEMGIQNAALAILIGSVFLGNEMLAKPALLYAMFTFWTTLIFAWGTHKVFYKKDWN